MISVAAGRSPVPEFSGKLAHLAGNGGNYDVLFLGSSRVRRQVSPQVFDAALQESGLAMKSYNFGLDGLVFPEILYVADEILALKPARLKYVFIELTRFGREFGPLLQPDSPRTIYWHTLRYTALQSQAIWVNPTPPPVMERLSLIGEHLEIFLCRAGNIGRGPEIMKAAGKRARVSTKVGPSGDGFFPVNEQFPSNRGPNTRNNWHSFRRSCARSPAPEPLFVEATLELFHKFQAAGITPIVVTMPRIHPTSPWVPEVNPSTDGACVMTPALP
jgi:hypothetical protein